jgi:hypothetical protein
MSLVESRPHATPPTDDKEAGELLVCEEDEQAASILTELKSPCWSLVPPKQQQQQSVSGIRRACEFHARWRKKCPLSCPRRSAEETPIERCAWQPEELEALRQLVLKFSDGQMTCDSWEAIGKQLGRSSGSVRKKWLRLLASTQLECGGTGVIDDDDDY